MKELEKNYVLANLEDMIYRTASFFDKTSMKVYNREIRQLKIHRFNT